MLKSFRRYIKEVAADAPPAYVTQAPARKSPIQGNTYRVARADAGDAVNAKAPATIAYGLDPAYSKYDIKQGSDADHIVGQSGYKIKYNDMSTDENSPAFRSREEALRASTKRVMAAASAKGAAGENTQSVVYHPDIEGSYKWSLSNMTNTGGATSFATRFHSKHGEYVTDYTHNHPRVASDAQRDLGKYFSGSDTATPEAFAKYGHGTPNMRLVYPNGSAWGVSDYTSGTDKKQNVKYDIDRMRSQTYKDVSLGHDAHYDPHEDDVKVHPYNMDADTAHPAEFQQFHPKTRSLLARLFGRK